MGASLQSGDSPGESGLLSILAGSPSERGWVAPFKLAAKRGHYLEPAQRAPLTSTTKTLFLDTDSRLLLESTRLFGKTLTFQRFTQKPGVKMFDFASLSSSRRLGLVVLLSTFLGLLSCGSETGDDDDIVGDDDDGTPDPGDFDSDQPVTGDWSCTGEQGGVLPGAAGTFEGLVEDFQDDFPIAGASVRIWLDNNPAGSVEDAIEATTDDNGVFTLDASMGVRACAPFAARVWTEFDPPETYQTFQNNIIVSGDAPYSEVLNSVSYATYQLLPLTVGVEPDAGKGIAAGRVTDCLDEPVAGAETSVGTIDWTTGSVTEAEGYAMRYFRDEDPAHDQLWTSDDGLFGGMNVPPGAEWSLLVWGIAQSEDHCHTTESGDIIRPEQNEAYCLLGMSSITVQPDSVNIANVKLNPVPDGCEQPTPG